MINDAVDKKEQEGFPEAMAVLKHIMEKKWKKVLFDTGVMKNGLSIKMNLCFTANLYAILPNNILKNINSG
jgi:hypothetical protein